MIGIIDYGAGNLHSVQKACRHLGLASRLVHHPGEMPGVTRLLLPGVGHFQSALRQLQGSGLFAPLQRWLAAGEPFLGICLGMQLLFSESEEGDGDCRGLAFFPGRVSRFSGRKTLHMGWNRVAVVGAPLLFAGLENGSYFYFIHRYRAAQPGAEFTAGLTDFAGVFPAVVAKGRVYGVQFHPEKSGSAGLRLLHNWGTRC